MPDDDPDAFEGPLGPPLPPDDRLWRHPSELAWGPTPPAAPPAPPTAGTPAGGRSPRLWSVALVSGLTGAVLTLGVVVLVGGMGRVTERIVERVPSGDEQPVLAAKLRAGVPGVAATVSPSVVRLDVALADGAVTGSGVVLRDDGTVLTNAHVVEGATAITIVLPDGTGVPGRVVGADRLTDLAVVVVEDGHHEDGDWIPAVFGSGADLEVGETAVAIGSPLGLAGGPSVTVGVVSGLGRRVSAGDLVLHDLIQTDAPIALGSSGGALCDGSGVVVGITTAVASSEVGADGLGFAIPAEVARAVADDLLGGGVAHAWLGIEGEDLAPTEVSLPGIAGMGGVRVVSVQGPSADAGLAPGDLVVAFEGERVRSMSDLVVALRPREPGEVVELEIRRGSEVLQLSVELGERP